jgi:hypothetical protein
MSPTCPSNCRELRQFEIWKDLLHLHTEVLSPNTLETVERRPLFPAFGCRGGRAANSCGEGERLDFSCPSRIKEEWDGKPLGHRQRWQNTVKRGDIETRCEVVKDVANYKAL